MRTRLFRFAVLAGLLQILAGCSALKNPALWNALSQPNPGQQAAGSGYSPPPTYAPVAVPQPALQATGLLLFGGRDHKVFLGCLNCSKFDSGSVWNKFGDYGSRIGENSIWNPIGTFGSVISDESPWNVISQTPPVIVDREGNFYGYFTANKIFPNRTTLPAMLELLDKHEAIRQNFDSFVDGLN